MAQHESVLVEHGAAPRQAVDPVASILESISDACVFLDREWRYTYVNRRAGELFGRDARSLVGKHIWTEFPEGVGQPFHLAYERAARERRVEQIEAYYPPWGRWFENRIFPADDGIAIFFQDVTERREREEERRRLAAIAEATSDLVALVTLDGAVEYLNPAGRRLLGVDPVGPPGRTFVEMHGAAVSAEEALALAVARGEWSGEMTLSGCGGRELTVLETLIVHPAQAGLRATVSVVARDISERKAAEQRAEREARARAEAERMAHLGFWQWDVKTNRVTWSEELFRIYGLDVSQFGASYEGYLERLHPDDRAHVGRAIQQAVTERAAFAFGERIVRPSGEIRHLRSWGTVSVGTDGGLTMFGTCIDITELIQATEGRRRSEEWLDIALEGARIGLWEWNLASGAVTWSSNLDNILGGARASDRGTVEGYIERVHPDDRVRLREAIDAALRENVRDLEMTYRLLFDEGDGRDPRWILARARVFRDEAGAPVRMAGSVVDITEARYAAAERQKLVSLVEHATDFIAVTSFDGRLLFLNEAGRLLAGIVRPGDVPKLLEELFPRTARETWRKVELPAVIANGRWEGEGLLENRVTGRALELDVTSFLVRDQDSGAALCVATVRRDITRHRELEEQLRHAQKMEAVGRLAAGVAHDFNNLLTIIGLTAGKLTSDPAIAPRMRDDVLAIDDAGKRGAALTRQLLAFTRQQVLSPEVMDVHAIVTDLLTMVRRLLPAHLALESALAPDTGRVRADRGQIGQVLLNLVVNARDAMPAGGTLTLSTFREGSSVCIAVRDTGAGMSRDVQARLFEPFFTTKGPGKGSGLGLSTAHGIVEQSGGTIDVTSTQGSGSCFVIRLPRIEECVTPTPPESPPAPRAGGITETVLVVDDELPLRRALGWALEDAGYRVHTAPGAEEALRVLAREQVDLLLTDVLMPGMSGVELARRAHDLQPTLRVVFMSGYADDPAASKMKAGAVIFSKPFGLDELARKVREVLDGTERPSQV